MAQTDFTNVTFPWVFPVPLSRLQTNHTTTSPQEQNANTSILHKSYTGDGKPASSHCLLTTSYTCKKIISGQQSICESDPLSEDTSRLQDKLRQDLSLQPSKECSATQSTTPTLSEQECAFQINGTTLYSCPVCKQTFPEFREVQEHVRSHPMGSRDYKCDICSKGFFSRNNLATHKHTHSKDLTFKCETCGRTFKYKGQLLEHSKTHTREMRYYCDECNFGTRNTCKLRYHKNSAHKQVLDFVCKTCGKNHPTPSDLKVHEAIHEEKKFKCEHCNKAFHHKRNLTVHEERHNPNRVKFQCEICGNQFTHLSGLQKHRLIVHFGQEKKTYQCEFCEKTVTSLGSLKVHRRKHTGEKPFSCDHCEKAFASRKVLAAHRRVHTGEKPFTCHLCNKSFSQRGTLTVHQRSHTGLRPYECEKCSKAFVTKTLLKTHMKSHS